MKDVILFKHSSIKINNIYIDPFNIDNEIHDANMIFVTHGHYDHFSIKDILRIKNEDTIIVITEDMLDECLKYFSKDKILVVTPNNKYSINNISFDTLNAYNSFHPIENNWVGYIININDNRYYIAGDTNVNKDLLSIKCDIAFVPIGGKFTMDYTEAAKFINTIKPKVVIPTHYGSIIGDSDLGNKFKELIDNNIECVVFIK